MNVIPCLAKQLADNFPVYLKNIPDTTLGCPDYYDQGGIHIVIMKDGQIKSWHFDTNINSRPIEIQDYVQIIKNIPEFII
jgi:hypothetical protein